MGDALLVVVAGVCVCVCVCGMRMLGRVSGGAMIAMEGGDWAWHVFA